MLSRKTKLTMMKIISMFSVVRGYNIPVVVLAQYLSAIYIFAPNKRALNVVLDGVLFLIVLASSLTIASGYIINNFYDSNKDLINRPTKSMLDRLVSQKTKLQVYFTLNFIVALLACFISFRAVCFFSAYIFLIWLYSHKLKRKVIIGNLTAALLAVLPFFAILLYYKNFYPEIMAHASFLGILILMREIIKDLENIQGDLANNYQTLPVKYGEKTAHSILTGLTIFTLVPLYFLIEVYDVGYMDLYFYSAALGLIGFSLFVSRSRVKKDYLTLHLILKFLIVTGVFSIVLINPKVLVHGRSLLPF
ncbi:geranylgeranylglycerol-phosphate geranylgeranyltransferase [Flavobacterium sp. N1719]|uniref:geranylgeranylglycerol-phosphate geranylgeranyltransferase n=1 Tax=Flavobacterium sp. N1719 TaxID=2885633 RepID=UPI002222737C|nr:geranylgeranylglycerol-phosphate geranylgeranyltransferase [Flavobacterium sp. N1719]